MLAKPLKMLLLTLLVAVLAPALGRAQSRLGKPEIEERLGYVVNVRSFSASKPLSQAELMGLVLELRVWGAFPEKYRGPGKVEGGDGYITRTMTRRFVHDLLGRDLRVWNAADQKDRLTWVDNTSNTMYERPFVRVIERKDAGPRRVVARFQIFEHRGNLANGPPLLKTGSGTATLERAAGNWVITSWQVNKRG